MAAAEQASPFLLCEGDVAFDLLAMLGRDQRADLGPLADRIAKAKAAGPFDEATDEIVVDAGLDKDARPGNAALSLARENAEQHAVDGLVEIGIGKDDVGRLAAQFEGDRHDLFRRDGADPASGGRTAGEGHLGDTGMGNEGRPGDGSGAGQYRQQAFRQAGFVAQLRQFKRQQWREFRWLDDHGVSRCQGRRNLLRLAGNRRIPWRDGGNHAQRFMGAQRQISAAGRGQITFEGFACGSEIAEGASRTANQRTGFQNRFAVILPLQLCQPFRLAFDQGGYAMQAGSPLMWQQVAPVRSAHCSLCFRHRFIDIGGAGRADGGEFGIIGRIAGDQRYAAPRLPFAGKEKWQRGHGCKAVQGQGREYDFTNTLPELYHVAYKE